MYHYSYLCMAFPNGWICDIKSLGNNMIIDKQIEP